MAENSKIEWADRATSRWTGCTNGSATYDAAYTLNRAAALLVLKAKERHTPFSNDSRDNHLYSAAVCVVLADEYAEKPIEAGGCDDQ